MMEIRQSWHGICCVQDHSLQEPREAERGSAKEQT